MSEETRCVRFHLLLAEAGTALKLSTVTWPESLTGVGRIVEYALTNVAS